MTVVSLAQASRRLGIDAKTLRRWLAEAQLPFPSHPGDGRKKGLSEEHLHVLARLHQRSLAPLSAEPASLAAQEPALSTTCLALCEQLSALQAQIAALQEQVADLGRLLQTQAHPVVSPALVAKPSRASKRSERPTQVVPRSAHAGKTPRKPVHVIPRVEYGSEGRYVVICPRQGLLPLEPETPEWFAWLATQSSFRFVGKEGHFTAHHRVKYGAWRAHRHIRNHSCTLRLAPTPELTVAVLEQTAAKMQAQVQ